MEMKMTSFGRWPDSRIPVKKMRNMEAKAIVCFMKVRCRWNVEGIGSSSEPMNVPK
jgi:hypothetical protein